MISLTTPRLTLRNFRPADAADLRELVVQYGASPLGIYDHKWPTTAEEIRPVVDWFASGDQFLAVCLKETGQLIGFVTLGRTENAEGIEYNLGYVFNERFHGQGYAAEACRVLLAHGFNAWGAQRVVAGTAALNERSCRLLARLGFRKVAEAPTHFQTAPDGTPYEFTGCLFALTREEWGGER